MSEYPSEEPVVSRAKTALMELTEQFGVVQELGDAPVRLERNPDNAAAFAHAIHLATYEHPDAFGSGYKKFSISGARFFFSNPGVSTFALGDGQQLQAAVSVRMTPLCLGAWETSYESVIPSVEVLFKHQDYKNLRAGRVLAAAAIGHILERGEDKVALKVTSSNTRMIRVYERFGFQQSGSVPSGGFKIVSMMLRGQEALEELHNKLQ